MSRSDKFEEEQREKQITSNIFTASDEAYGLVVGPSAMDTEDIS